MCTVDILYLLVVVGSVRYILYLLVVVGSVILSQRDPISTFTKCVDSALKIGGNLNCKLWVLWCKGYRLLHWLVGDFLLASE